MKIFFLGTSAGWPLPRLGCNCHICSSKDQKDTRFRPAVLINDSILIDCGPDIYHQFQKFKINPSKISTLILTHAHPDHVLGFYDLTHIYNRVEKTPKLITTQEVLNGLRQTHRFALAPFKPDIVRANEVIEVESVKTILFPVEHSRMPCSGIKMKQDRLFVYLPDIVKLRKQEYKKCRDVHLLVLDGSSLGEKGHAHTHQTIEEGIKLAWELKPKKCYFTHIGHITGIHIELEKCVQKMGGKNFHIAYDGLELEI